MESNQKNVKLLDTLVKQKNISIGWTLDCVPFVGSIETNVRKKISLGRAGALLVAYQSLSAPRNYNSQSRRSLERRPWRLQVHSPAFLKIFRSNITDSFISIRYSDNALLRWSAICVAIDFARCWVTFWIDGRQVADEPLVT